MASIQSRKIRSLPSSADISALPWCACDTYSPPQRLHFHSTSRMACRPVGSHGWPRRQHVIRLTMRCSERPPRSALHHFSKFKSFLSAQRPPSRPSLSLVVRRPHRRKLLLHWSSCHESFAISSLVMSGKFMHSTSVTTIVPSGDWYPRATTGRRTRSLELTGAMLSDFRLSSSSLIFSGCREPQALSAPVAQFGRFDK